MKELNQTMYIIVKPTGEAQVDSLWMQKGDCIKRFMHGSVLTWKEAQEIGWSVQKVKVTITPIT